MLAFNLITLALSIRATCASNGQDEQFVLEQKKEGGILNVAIVGAGAGGSSAAYYLNKFAGNRYNITIFERSDYVGGRSTTVNAYNNTKYPIELGASIFVSANKILVEAAKRFGLETQEFAKPEDDAFEDAVGFWDGKTLFLQVDSGWFSNIKILWRYGWSPIRANNLTKSFIKKFLQYFYDSSFPFYSLTDMLYEANFTAAANSTGAHYLSENGVSEKYSEELIQSLTRVNYAQNLDQLHGLASLVSLAAENAYQIKGGNWRIFQSFIQESSATLNLRTQVTSITKSHGTEKWTLWYDDLDSETPGTENFDVVILASPISLSNITSEVYPPENVRYVNLHVTLFTSKQKLSSEYFKLTHGTPSHILTTPNSDKSSSIPFFSISILTYLNETSEYVFKIFSASEIDEKFIGGLFSEGNEINWIYRKVWNSYPYLVPTSNFSNFELEKNFWHLNTMESFISTMETSALAGANVAALISHGHNSTELRIP